MLNKTYEWLRTADITPDSAAVESRQKTVADLRAILNNTQDAGAISQYVTGACAGLTGYFTNDSPFVSQLVEAIRKYQAAFPSDLSENAQDLQITCALVIGENLSLPIIRGETALTLTASLVLSCLGLRRTSAGRHISDILSELSRLAKVMLATRAEQERTRVVPEIDNIADLAPPAEATTLWEAVEPQLSKIFNALSDNARIDREEIEVLWWFYNRYSHLLKSSIDELPVPVAALACGVEIADCVNLPPHAGATSMVAGAVAANRKNTEVGEKALSDSIAQWTSPRESCLIPRTDKTASVVGEFPAIFPLTWICRRLKDSNHSNNWKSEITEKTGLESAMSVSPAALSSQVFHERTAQRLLQRSLKE